MTRPEDLGAPSNWGRWGGDDESGTTNLLNSEMVRHAAGLVTRGDVYSLAAPVSPDGPNLPTRRPTWHVVAHRPRASGEAHSADDVIMMHTHGTTHVDGLAHFFVGDTLYNGHPSSALQPFGAQRCGMQNSGPIVGRGVMLDVAAHRGVQMLGDGEAIEPDELDACAASQGVELRAGDIILVRTGWWRLFSGSIEDRQRFYASEPGPSAACSHWFRGHDFVALGADNPGVEVVAGWTQPLYLHRDVIWGCGGYLLEFLDLEALSRDRVYEFLFVATPLKIEGGIGSPIAPVAIV
jgi:kynurenine formamidase